MNEITHTPNRLQESSEEVCCFANFPLHQVFGGTEVWRNEDSGILYANDHVEEAEERNVSGVMRILQIY